MASKGSSDSALNEYFEAISFQDEEEKTWQRYTELLVSKIESLGPYIKDSLQIPIGISAYGSSVEKLRIILPENIGDIDVMVFPLSDEMKITESIMEYSIPGNPIFVRLRGNNHAILQHCLAENSDYVASSTLKDFHSKVFGNAKDFFEVIPRIFKKMQDLYSDGFATSAVNETLSPALQLDFVQPRVSLRDHVAEMKSLSNFKFNKDMRGFCDWMAIAMNPGKPFTEEHSATIDEFAILSEEKVQQLSANPSIDNFENTLNAIAFDPKVIELRNKVKEIDRKVAEKVKKSGANGPKASSETEDQVEEEVIEGSQTKQGDESEIQIESRRFDSSQSTRRDSGDVHEGLDKKLESSISEQTQMSEQINSITGDGKEMKAKDEAGISVPLKEGQETDFAKLTQERIYKFCIDSVLGFDNSFKSFETLRKDFLDISEDQTKQKGGMDLVPAFLAKGWPSAARAWISRDRSWPNPDVISNILEYGFHLVVKTPKESDRPDLDFRLSFSHAEYVLSKELNDIQRQCYRCFKSYLLTITRNKKPKIVATYFLKTILFWAIEETGMAFWSSEYRGTCVLMLLGKLLKALETKLLPHFFIPEFNLLEDAVNEFPGEINAFAEEVRRICENPMSYPNVSPESHTTKATNEPISEGLPAGDAAVVQTCLTAEDKSHGRELNVQPNENVTAKKQHSTVPENDLDTTQQHTTGNSACCDAPFFSRYSDFQVLYREVYQELLSLALKEESVDTESPIVKSIVTNIREVISKMKANPEKEMERVFECSLENVYTSLILHSGPDLRHKILSVLKGQCEMFAYVARQDDIMVPGNEYLILDRMLNSSSDGSTDSFDLSSLYPLGNDALRNILGIVEHQFDPIEQRKDDVDDDIPLD